LRKLRGSLCWPESAIFFLHVSLAFDNSFLRQTSLMFKPSVTSLCELGGEKKSTYKRPSEELILDTAVGHMISFCCYWTAQRFSFTCGSHKKFLKTKPSTKN